MKFRIKHLKYGLFHFTTGQALVELLVVIGLSSIFLPALVTALFAARGGEAQQSRRIEALALLRETEEVVRVVREKGWSQFAVNGIYHPVITGNTWSFAANAEIVNDLSRQLVISDVRRDDNGFVVSSGGNIDPSTKKVEMAVSWTEPRSASVSSTIYVTNFLGNVADLKTLQSEFDVGVKQNVRTTNVSGGEIALALNKAKWCSPEYASTTIDLPDGPPVAVTARANSSSTAIPNDVLVATSPTASSSVKLAYVKVTADSDPPASTLNGIFTMDAGKYSNASYVPSGTGLDNDFKTNDVKYYTSSSGKLYALLATNLPDKEVIAVLIDDADLQDPTNKIYKYKTFFNTKQYYGDTRSTPNQDQTPFGYGGVSLDVFEDRGYAISGGYLYVFDLSDIDSKSTTNGLDMVGCRIQLDGYDCSPGTGTDRKYSSGQTGTNWSDTTSPAHNDCSDGGNTELYANNDIQAVKVGSSTYVYVAVGAGTNPEFDIVNVTNVPSSSSWPRIYSSSCGRISGGNSGWKRVSSLDFNTDGGTEEAANSVFANADGSRAYVSSNGGIFGGGGSNPDSWQFYVLNTSNKNSPSFLSGTPGTGATSGYYYGSSPEDELFPRRSLTVLNGERVVLVGKDGFSSNGDNPKDYQVLNLENETSPQFCGGLDFDSGFNDLISVSEADGDNFVYMVANTQEKQLKIVQGGPDAIYVVSGVYTPPVYDFGSAVTLNRITFSVDMPAGTSIQTQVAGADPVNGSCSNANFQYVGPDGTGSTYFNATGGPLPLRSSGSYLNPSRCFSYKSYLATTDYNTTPTILDVTINYSP